MSEVKVNKISPRSGTDVQLGDSGDTITVPSGATFDASNATTTLPATVVTTDGSQTLTNKTIDASQLTGTITPSDNTVSLAKLTATGTKDATTFLRGDNTFASAGLSGWSENGANNNLLPASASAGIYLGVNSVTASNLLDDYEEGTWTPTYTGSGGAGNAPTGDGSYTKIGNLVHVDFSLVGITTTGTSGDLRITGLPFPCNQTSGVRGSFNGNVRFYNHDLSGTTRYHINTGVSDNTSEISFTENGDNTTWVEIAAYNGTGISVEGGITYRTNS